MKRLSSLRGSRSEGSEVGGSRCSDPWMSGSDSPRWPPREVWRSPKSVSADVPDGDSRLEKRRLATTVAGAGFEPTTFGL